MSSFLEEIAAITLNYNRSEDTTNCVRSLAKAGLSTRRIWIIDNGSEEEDFRCLEASVGHSCNIIRSPQNLGYAAGMNLGIKLVSRSHPPSWFLLLNNDTTVDQNFFKEMLDAAQENPRFDILGPVILYESDPQKIWFFGSKAILKTPITLQLYQNKHYSHLLPTTVEVDFLSGCCMLIKSKVFEVIGYFNEKYFMYGEDVDFCWRALRSNLKLGVVTKALMWHKVSASSTQNRHFMTYLRVKNQNDFYRSSTRGIVRLIMFLFSLYLLQKYVVTGALYGRKNFRLQPYLSGWLHGWF